MVTARTEDLNSLTWPEATFLDSNAKQRFANAFKAAGPWWCEGWGILSATSASSQRLLAFLVLQVTLWMFEDIQTFRMWLKVWVPGKTPTCCVFVFRSWLKALSSSPVKVDSIQCAMVDRCLKGESAVGLFIWVKESLWCPRTRTISNSLINKIHGAKWTLIENWSNGLQVALKIYDNYDNMFYYGATCMWYHVIVLCAIYETATCEMVLW